MDAVDARDSALLLFRLSFAVTWVNCERETRRKSQQQAATDKTPVETEGNRSLSCYAVQPRTRHFTKHIS